MGIIRRLLLIAKGYVTSTSERLNTLAAEEERAQAQARKAALAEVKELADADTISRRYPKEITAISSEQSKAELSQLSADYRLLGLTNDADLQTVEVAWRELARRADPKRFPSGSEEEKRAAEILDSINSAYARIRESINPTEGRFGQLEL